MTKTILITGAGGFVGSQLARQLANTNANLILLDQNLTKAPKGENITHFEGDLTDSDFRSKAIGAGVDILFHLATIPGGAAEANRDLSRKINIDASISLFDEICAKTKNPKIIFTSTIAVLPAPPPEKIDDDTKLMPFLTYGAHKLMCEIYLADLHRRKEANVVSLRLPGILARPIGPSGMKSAFLSDIFHAALKGEEFLCPVSKDGVIWAMSVHQIANNLIHAANLESDNLPPQRAITLPALRFSLEQLAQALDAKVKFGDDKVLEQQFASQPPLEAKYALDAGFEHDGTIENLVARALDNIKNYQ